MYTFGPVTERIFRIRERVRDRVVRYDAERARIITEAYQATEDTLPIIRRPKAFYALCEKMSLLVDDDEILVGNKGPTIFSSPCYPEWGTTDWVIDDIESGRWTLEDGEYRNPAEDGIKYIVSEEDFEYLRSIRPYWEHRRVGRLAEGWKPDCFEELARLEVSSYKLENGLRLISMPCGHLIAGYKKIIETGYQAIRDEAQAWLDENRFRLMGEDVNKALFYQSVVITCDAAMLLTKRYAEMCREKAEACADPARKKELEQMAETLAWLEKNPARNFREALQGILLYQVMIWIYDMIPSPSLGRVDQYVWPYLKKELEEGTMTLPEAQELIDAFFLKCNCFYSAGSPRIVQYAGIGNTYQNTTLGGVDPKTGEDASNPVTYMIFETIGRLKLHDPTLIFRTHKGTPETLWECAMAVTKQVGGLPLYYNDEIVIPALVNEGHYELEDARNYGCIGCQEIVGIGNDYPAPNGLHPPHCSVMWGSVLNMAINDGRNPYNGEQASIHTGFLYEMNSIEEVREAVRKMAYHCMNLLVSVANFAESVSQFSAPEAILSISIEGCMEKGKDVVNGGAKYNSYGGAAVGLATVADSLSTIKYMCFDKKLCTTRELYDAVMANWEGYEVLRQQILAVVPHFGNNDPYADMEMKWVVDLYHEICTTMYSVRSKFYKGGLYGASDHVVQGKETWGTPDGRKYPDPIADAASPAQSRDKEGPTSVFMSSCCYDNSQFLGGIALNLRMHPSVLANEEGTGKLIGMTQQYFENGGMEVQYNVVDTDTLRAAQKEPEKYRDLVVRIAGYSAYFAELSRDLQNDIISRNENRI